MLVILYQISEVKRTEIVTGYARMSTALVVPLENEIFMGDSPGHAWRIRKYTIRKIIKTRFGMTSFYMFLLLHIEDRNSSPPQKSIFLKHIAPDESAGICRYLKCPATYID